MICEFSPPTLSPDYKLPFTLKYLPAIFIHLLLFLFDITYFSLIWNVQYLPLSSAPQFVWLALRKISKRANKALLCCLYISLLRNWKRDGFFFLSGWGSSLVLWIGPCGITSLCRRRWKCGSCITVLGGWGTGVKGRRGAIGGRCWDVCAVMCVSLSGPVNLRLTVPLR